MRRSLKDGALICGAQGMGGVGKTALALKLAEELKPRYPDAQFYLDLRGASGEPLSATRAMEHIIRAYHPTAKLPDEPAALSALFHSALEGKRALLLWDNVKDAAQVAPLRPPATCLMLVTSRRHFAIQGLHSIGLDQMTEKEACELLLKIEPRIGGEAKRIAKLCGYLPLALELAASALKVRKGVSPPEFALRLSDSERRTKLLDKTDSERKIEASRQSSYGLLDEVQRKLWRALAVFPETFDYPAAAVWQAKDDEARDALDDLVAYSLVEYDESKGRYRLHDLASDFAEAMLGEDEGERDEAKLRHAAHFQQLLSDANDLYWGGGNKVVEALAMFDRERINTETGQRWCAEKMDSNLAAARLAKVYAARGISILGLRLHPRERIEWLNVGMRACHKLDGRSGEGVALGYLGQSYADLGETRRAIEFYEQALVIAREIGDRRGEGAWLGYLGRAYADLGEARKAIGFHEQALVIDREIGDRRGEGADLGNLGRAYSDLDETSKAIEYYEQSIELAREIGYRYLEANNLLGWGDTLVKLGEADRAIEMIEAALSIYEQIESPRAETARKRLAELTGE